MIFIWLNRYHSDLCLNLKVRQTCIVVVVVYGNLYLMVVSWGDDSRGSVYLISALTVNNGSKGTRSVHSFFKLIHVPLHICGRGLMMG